MRIIDCDHFKKMLISAANNLDNKHLEIDKLNVFPVPDGDTGTNMNMTFFDAVKETAEYNNSNIGDCSKFLAKHMLMGARGNSGVILSQIFKGFAKKVEGLNKITVEDFSKALLNSYQSAYKAVMRPVEGTILTVIRETADYGYYYYENHKNCSFEEFFEYLTLETKKSLDSTPELLPVLKEVGVVDSGGAGVYAIIEGMNFYFQGKPVQNNSARTADKESEGYCLECAIDLNERYKKEFDNEGLVSLLSANCSEIKLKRENNIVMIHAHTLKPAEPISVFTRLGILKQTKLEPLSNEHQEIFNYDKKETEHVKYALISVCSGKGIEDTFRALHVNYIISGGQTMNPSTEDFINVINDINADYILILPNNSNIILAANQAKDIALEKNITVLESKTICEGVNACIAFNSEKELPDNIAAMNEAIRGVKTFSLTYSIKDTQFNGVAVKKNEYIGIADKNILAHGFDVIETAKAMMDSATMDDYSYITIYYGNTINDEQANNVLDYLKEKYDVDGQTVNGQQDLYPFIIAAE